MEWSRRLPGIDFVKDHLRELHRAIQMVLTIRLFDLDLYWLLVMAPSSYKNRYEAVELDLREAMNPQKSGHWFKG